LSDGLARFNDMPRDEAEQQLRECFASRAWAGRVADGRPYADLAQVLAACDSAWVELAPVDWMAALAAHPRIGEKGGHAPESSELEQSNVRSAAAETMAALAEGNRRYEKRFGHVFLISAAGRTADEILAALRERIRNDPGTEVAVAASELRKIARLRLERMLSG
jgi:OHCU decarboxylase